MKQDLFDQPHVIKQFYQKISRILTLGSNIATTNTTVKKIRATTLLHILKEKYMYVYIKKIRATALLHILKEK
jgi:hypothetical protein